MGIERRHGSIHSICADAHYAGALDYAGVDKLHLHTSAFQDLIGALCHEAVHLLFAWTHSNPYFIRKWIFASVSPVLSCSRPVGFILVALPLLCQKVQDRDDKFEIQRAAARYAKTIYKAPSIGFDDRAKDFIARPEPPTRHPAAQAAILAQDLGASLVQFPDGTCNSLEEKGCIQIVVRIGIPDITGDSATVWLYTYDARYSEQENSQLLVKRRGSDWQALWVLEVRRIQSGG